MLDRADSLPLSGPTAAFPGWARAKKPPESEAEAAFLAGAALARLDELVRAEPVFAGVWRRRLALAAAAASVARAGRREDEAALRDGFHLTRPGADPGPAGRWLLAWRALATGSAGPWRSRIVVAAEIVQVPADDGAALGLRWGSLRARSVAIGAVGKNFQLTCGSYARRFCSGFRRASAGSLAAKDQSVWPARGRDPSKILATKSFRR